MLGVGGLHYNIHFLWKDTTIIFVVLSWANTILMAHISYLRGPILQCIQTKWQERRKKRYSKMRLRRNFIHYACDLSRIPSKIKVGQREIVLAQFATLPFSRPTMTEFERRKVLKALTSAHICVVQEFNRRKQFDFVQTQCRLQIDRIFPLRNLKMVTL